MFAARQAALVLALCTLASASVAAAPQVDPSPVEPHGQPSRGGRVHISFCQS